MALAISAVTNFKDSGQEFRGETTLTGSGTYTTNGETVDWTTSYTQKIKTRSKPTFGIGFTLTGYLAVYDVANDKVMLWNGTTEFTNGASLVGVTVYMTFFFPKK